MTKTEIKNKYNIDKIVTAKELASLSKTYQDNLDTIIVMMKRKEKNTQPPAWFKNFADKIETFIIGQKQFNKKILKRLVKTEVLLNNIIKLNNLKIE